MKVSCSILGVEISSTDGGSGMDCGDLIRSLAEGGEPDRVEALSSLEVDWFLETLKKSGVSNPRGLFLLLAAPGLPPILA